MSIKSLYNLKKVFSTHDCPSKISSNNARLTPNQSMAVEDYNGNFVNMTIKAGSKKKFDNVLIKLGQTHK